jgi:hypothetical protein
MSSSIAAFLSSLIPISFADADESTPVAEDVSSSQTEEESEEVPEPEDVRDFVIFRVLVSKGFSYFIYLVSSNYSRRVQAIIQVRSFDKAL